ncbi:nucleoside triphosphate pyrophosphohydrolase [Candidatus Albibeggiatoa sp. nov. NOAA]|uniref:nucleoside triphosphate pyrophosphohydrolase n=1 Tax=Candidatus Albibeggiatoa sp. nov. NOAA TaxID=3162724 RepID=UPI0032F52092|nr:nucleoside triphosphate pyrophosphohydrolase [Thiotrichaceae bacterium]
MNTSDDKYCQAFTRLLQIMDDLREKCPWDKKQTMQSLRHLTIEETYELSDAVLDNDLPEIKKELGDLLLHIVFYAKIGSEQQAFDMADIIDTLCDKVISRHPHVYGDAQADDAQAVKQRWEVQKLKEDVNRSVLAGVPQSLPALIKAYRMQEKVRGVGFDWDNKEQVWDKVEEEMQEFKNELDVNNTEKMEDEFGDILFALVNYARFVGVNPETALERTNKRFMKRFKQVEVLVRQDKKDLHDMELEEMDQYWKQAKKDVD